MEKNILFRAKTTNTGDWIYGYPFPVVIEDITRWFVIPSDTYCPKDITIGELQVEVDFETISQLIYTSKSGVQHFIGDIYDHNYYPDCDIRLYYDEVLSVMGQVYDEDGEYESITIIPSDLENKMTKTGNIWEV